MEFKKIKKCKVGLALYNFDGAHFTGTQAIGLELARNITGLEQSIIDYRVLLRHDVLPEQFGLPVAVCLSAPPPVYPLSKRIQWKARGVFYKGLDAIRGAFGFLPNLGYYGSFQIKDWVRSLDLDLFYFPSMWQHDLILDIPIAAQLYDMQHIYYPQFWESAADRFQRQTVLGWYGRNAALITCNFDFVAQDIKKYLQAPEEKVDTIFLAPPVVPKMDRVYANSIKEKFNLPENYFIYPAATWPHKNHLNLVRALGECVSSGLEVFCVCPGEYADWVYPNQFLKIQEEIKKYKVEKNICFLGNIPHKESLALIQQADFLCMPSLYEAGCYTIWEACCLGKAVACSEVTMIPYQISDAGILFDPNDPSDIARAIQLLHRDERLRDDLGKKAKKLIEDPYYNPEKTALGYHRSFVNALVRLGKLSREFRIEDDPASPLDRRPRPQKFEWRHLLK